MLSSLKAFVLMGCTYTEITAQSCRPLKTFQKAAWTLHNVAVYVLEDKTFNPLKEKVRLRKGRDPFVGFVELRFGPPVL